jgi:glucosamine-6-phosphate deaminase
VKDTLAKKKHGESDNPEVLEVKALIRQTEALSAAISAGTSEKNVYFLDLPFYETGKVKKKPVGPEDVRIVKELMNSIKPDHIYAAGDLTDPHGTHRSCLVSILKAFN